VGLTGRTLVPATPIACSVGVRAETRLGLLTSNSLTAKDAILDPQHHLRTRIRSDGPILAVAGTTRVTLDEQAVTVTDRAGHSRSVPVPSTIGTTDDGYVSADDRYVAVPFTNPACPGPRQCLDMWVLDLSMMRWLHVPSMPVAVALKQTTEFWGAHDQLFFLGSFDGPGDMVAMWQPHASELAVRKVTLPKTEYGILDS